MAAPWQERLFSLSRLKSEQKGKASTIILAKPEADRELSVPYDVEIATASIIALLEDARKQAPPLAGTFLYAPQPALFRTRPACALVSV